MKKNVELTEVRQLVADYVGKTGPELREELNSLFIVGAETFARMAAIVMVADEAGVTRELGLQGSQITALRRIGRGEIVPAAYARFGGTRIETSLPALSAARQRDLADGGGVDVYSFDNGRVDKREVPPLKLTGFERSQVFGRDGIRDAAEQRSWLETIKKQRVQAAEGTWIVDAVHHRLIVRIEGKEVSLSRDELLDYLKQL